MSMNLKKKSIAHVFNVIIVMQKLLHGPTACNKTFYLLHAIRLFIRLILYWRFIRILKIQIEYHYNNQYYSTFNYFTIPTTIKLGKKHFKEETLTS